MRWRVEIRFVNQHGTDSHLKTVALCFDIESVGIVERALEFSGQTVRVTKEE